MEPLSTLKACIANVSLNNCMCRFINFRHETDRFEFNRAMKTSKILYYVSGRWLLTLVSINRESIATYKYHIIKNRKPSTLQSDICYVMLDDI